MTLRIGLYGGCFNPVHNGHLAAARAAKVHLSLDEVVFIPSGHPPLKGRSGLIDGQHRMAMLEAALAGEPGMRADAIELGSDGPSYTVDTVETLKALWPEDTELYFLLGSDCLDRLPRWKGIDRLHALLRFAVFARNGEDMAEMDPRLIAVPMTPVPHSSTAIRAAVAAGSPIADQLSAAVADYIRRHDLYSVSEAAHV